MSNAMPDIVPSVREHRLVFGVVGAVVLLSGVSWVLRPEEALRWLRHMLTLPALGLVLALWYLATRRAARDDAPAVRRYFGEALTLLIVAMGIRKIVLLGLGIWVHLSERGAELEVEHRLLGLTTAVVFVLVGNRLPKILTPLAMLPLHLAERVSRARRAIGGTWLVLGIGMAIAFLALPLPAAESVELAAVVAGVLTILAGIVWMNLGPARPRP